MKIKFIEGTLTWFIIKRAVYREKHYKSPKFKEGDIVIRNWMAKVVIPKASDGKLKVVESLMRYRNSAGLVFVGDEGRSGGDEFWYRKARWWDYVFREEDLGGTE